MVNKVFILGRVGKEVELRHTASGVTVANYTVATTEKYGDKETTTWHNIVAFKKTAEIAKEYIRKGDMTYVEGKIQNRTWDKPDGTKGYASEIVAFRIVLLGNKKQNNETKDVDLSRDDSGIVGSDGFETPF